MKIDGKLQSLEKFKRVFLSTQRQKNTNSFLAYNTTINLLSSGCRLTEKGFSYFLK
jgi:hypothetical protein